MFSWFQAGFGWFFGFRDDWEIRTANGSVGAVEGLQNVEVKLFSARHADIKPVLLNRIRNLLCIDFKHILSPLKRRVVKRRAVDGAKDGLLFFRQGSCRTGKKSGGKQFYFRQIVGLDEFPAQPGTAVGDGPAGLVGIARKLTVEGDGFDLHFFAILPNQRPTGAAGDAGTLVIGFGRPMNFRPGRNYQPADVIDVLRHQADDGRLHGRGINRNDGFTRDQTPEWGIRRAQFFVPGSACRVVCE